MRNIRIANRRTLEEEVRHRGGVLMDRSMRTPFGTYRTFNYHSPEGEVIELSIVAKGIRPNWQKMVDRLPGPGIVYTL